MDPVKEAFQKIKEEIISIKEEMGNLSTRLLTLETQQIRGPNPTQTSFPTDTPTHNPTLPHEMKGSKMPFFEVSTGNGGVPTDKSTDRQTNQQTDNIASNREYTSPNNSILALEKAKEALDSLDSIRKEIRLKFKRLTTKEMLLFSTIYSLEERGMEEITYKLLANNLNLTESSIRDYANRLILKGIPLVKTKLNNKQITLNISLDFQRIASLQTVLRLRDL
jgi:hypothetical protein